ncbi:MAG TPA: YbbR-like domain-containing protein [Longimicrobiales bacterium]
MRWLVDLLTRNWTIKLTALLLAVLLWTIVKSEELTRVPVENVPIEVALRDPGWMLASPPSPPTATVVFSGPLRELVRLAVARPRVVVPVDEVGDSIEVRQLRTGWVQLEGDLARTRTEDIRPGAVLLTFERLTTRLVPVTVRTRGDLPPGLDFAAPVRVEPPAIRVSGPRHAIEALDSVVTVPVELGGLRGSAAIGAEVDTTGLGNVILSPASVDVVVRVRPAIQDTAVLGTPADGVRHPGSE